MNPSDMRKIRLKEIAVKSQSEAKDWSLNNIYSLNPSRDQLDNGRFLSKYFDLMNNKQFT